MPTDEQWKTLVRIVKKKLAEHDQAIEDLWKKVNADFDTETSIVDEAVEKVERNHRELLRLKQRVKELEDRE